ncbi:hypothetical protein JCM3263A_19880 [Thermobifida fusca]|uniref:Uncharacterized protein n=3 Tax=Thermobifida fusca TaxID=2021 RepID=A0A9P2WQQ9_THEFU|nr:hypothetical protein [Thermobifida fusca]AAZ55570.1 hypothetical protein Tfu_1534 [Thermobifida fusca YX]EOR71415.1 hypothetical protein TM51_08011 [Thermobifida fusca TM51]MDD6792726.1 hypothetical protein [Thermobifida fusca]PPS91761.1 hypothetical protein BH05_13430 [Thermobifida fusca]PZN64376.1 MAG: hypothetical protein DIU53_06310 [Thermobifida fusca]
MRHFFGFVFGLLLGPVLLVAGGWVTPRVGALVNSTRGFFGPSEFLTLAALMVLALVVALVLVPPKLTPLIPGMAGVVLTGATVAHVLQPKWADQVFAPLTVPGLGVVQLPGEEGVRALLEAGLVLPLAVAFLIPLFFPSRWRSYRPRGAHAAEADEDDEGFAALLDDRDDEPISRPV